MYVRTCELLIEYYIRGRLENNHKKLYNKYNTTLQ